MVRPGADDADWTANVVLIIGHRGQDGYYLHQQLRCEDIAVFGLGRQGLEAPDGTVDSSVMLSDPASIQGTIARLCPREIYYLAAHHHSAQSLADDGALLGESLAVNTLGLATVLEAVRLRAPQARLFYAASSHVFGDPPTSRQSEDTAFAPRSPYAVSKAAGIELCRYFRRTHGVFAACGILYNHDSPRRSPEFLTRKTAMGVAAIAGGRTEPLVLGTLDAVVDWGYAPDYVDAMRRIVALPEAADFVVASGRASTVRDFVAAAFASVSLDWRAHVSIDPSLLRRAAPAHAYVGDPRRLAQATGWQAATTIDQLARLMVEAEMARSVC